MTYNPVIIVVVQVQAMLVKSMCLFMKTRKKAKVQNSYDTF
jgi:hypothetical protein